MDKFLKTYINKTKIISEKIHNINEGGCGFFAYFLYLKLRNSGFKKISIRPLLHDESGVKNDDFRKLVLTNNFIEYASHKHIMIHVVHKKKNYLLDSHNIYTFDVKLSSGMSIVDMWDDDSILGNKIPVDLLEKGLDNTEYWADKYNRKQNGLLKKLINEII